MDIATPQVLGVIAAVITTVAVLETLRRGIVPERFAALWVIVSLFLLTLALFPRIADWLAEVTGVAIPANLLFFASSVLLLLVSIQFSYEFGKFETRIRRLAEELALLRNEVAELHQQPKPNPDSTGSTPE